MTVDQLAVAGLLLAIGGLVLLGLCLWLVLDGWREVTEQVRADAEAEAAWAALESDERRDEWFA